MNGLPFYPTFTPYTANDGPMRIQYKCMVPINVFPEMKLLFPKLNYNVLSPSSYTYISVRDLYISRIGLPILLQGILRTDPGYIYVHRSQTHECGNWDWGRANPRKVIHKWDFPCSVGYRPVILQHVHRLTLISGSATCAPSLCWEALHCNMFIASLCWVALQHVCTTSLCWVALKHVHHLTLLSGSATCAPPHSAEWLGNMCTASFCWVAL